MAATTVASSVIRYAPDDPTLPKPWKGLIDGTTGYLYFWNPETNVTQYDRPAGAAPLPNPSPVSVISSAQVQQSSYGQHRDGITGKAVDKYVRGGDVRIEADPRFSENARTGQTNGSASATYGGLSALARHAPAVEKDMSPEDYCRQHEITVSGDQVPPPLMSFEATGLPPEILREVRCLLLRGANVVRCATLSAGPCK